MERLREELSERHRRREIFDRHKLSGPIWDIVLNLANAAAEDKPLSVSSLCMLANCPQTTALRHIYDLERDGLLVRVRDPNDGRRRFAHLSAEGLKLMRRYLDDNDE
ncbi:MAG: winged helix DNA-binding protein [Sphingomonadaceae bacterium]|nr:winged helix DNA-binding protein [Sphingomonadaceae bacterium]